MSSTPQVGFGFGVEGDQSLLSTIKALREEIQKVKGAQDQTNVSAAGLNRAWSGLSASSGEARHSIMLLGEETGVHVPRAVAGLISRIGPLQGILEKAFPVLGVAALIAVLGKALSAWEEHRRKVEENREAYIHLDGEFQDASTHIKAEIDKQREKFISLTEGPVAALTFALANMPSVAIPALKQIEAELSKMAAQFEKQSSWFNTFGAAGDDVKKFSADLEEGMRNAPDEAQRFAGGLKIIDAQLKVVQDHIAFLHNPMVSGRDTSATAAPYELELKYLKDVRNLLVANQELQAQTKKTATKTRDVAAADEARRAGGEEAKALADAEQKAAQEELKNYLRVAGERAELDKIAYDNGVISLEQYYARRRTAITNGVAAEQSAIQREAAALLKERNSLASLPVGPKPTDQVARKKELNALDEQIAAKGEAYYQSGIKGETELAKAEQDGTKAKLDHQLKALEFEKQLAELQGNRTKAAQLANQIDDQKITRELQQLGKTQVEIDALLAQLRAARNVKASGEEARRGFQSGYAGLESQAAAIKEKGAGPNGLSPYEVERQLAALYQDEIPKLQQKVELLRQQAAIAAAHTNAKGEPDQQGLSVGLATQAEEDAAKIAKLRAELAKMDTSWMQWQTGAKNAIGQVSGEMTSGFNSWIEGHKRFGQAAAQMWNSVVMTALGAIEKIAASYLAKKAIMALADAGFISQRTALEATGAAARLAITLPTNAAIGMSNAGVAATGAMAATADIPIVGPVVAAAAGAATFGEGVAYIAATGLANGGMVRAGMMAARNFSPGGRVSGPGTSTSDSIPAMLSHGEYVVNARAVRNIGPETLEAINRGAFLPPIRQSAPYSAAGLHRYASGGMAGGEYSHSTQSGPTFSHTTHIGPIQTLDGASVRSALEEHGDLVGDIAVAAVRRDWRGGGVAR